MMFSLYSSGRLSGMAILAGLILSACSEPNSGQDADPQQESEPQQIDQPDANPQKAFLAAHASEEGAIVLPSGLQYRVLESGSGATPEPTSMVKVHYRGQLIDGTEFDSSYGGEPAEFPANRLIAGWVEALQLMQEGDKWELVIPAELAYGSRGAGNVIPPDATLVFVMELIEVLK